jgi:hypothetical protein
MKNFLSSLTERELDEDFDNGDDEAQAAIRVESARREMGRARHEMLAQDDYNERHGK